MPCRALLLLCAALAVSGAANPRQLEAVRHFLQRHHRQAAAPAPPHVLRTFIEPKQQQQKPNEQEQQKPNEQEQQEPKEQEHLAPQEPTPTPSPWFDCPTPFGLYPDSYNCSCYFQCNQGFAFEQHCQPELEFNPKTLSCDWPVNIDPPCQAIPYPTASGPQPAEKQGEAQSREQLKSQDALQEPTPTPTPWFECPIMFGLFPDPYNCSSYFQCSYGVAFEEKCQSGLQFNPVSSTCDWPANINPPCHEIQYPTTTQAPAQQGQRGDDAVATAAAARAPAIRAPAIRAIAVPKVRVPVPALPARH